MKVTIPNLLLIFVFLLLCIQFDAHADLVADDGAGGQIVLTDSACAMQLPESYSQGAANTKAPIFQSKHFEADKTEPELGCWYSPLPTAEDIKDFQEQMMRHTQDTPQVPVKIVQPVNIFNGIGVETIKFDLFKPVTPHKSETAI